MVLLSLLSLLWLLLLGKYSIALPILITNNFRFQCVFVHTVLARVLLFGLEYAWCGLLVLARSFACLFCCCVFDGCLFFVIGFYLLAVLESLRRQGHCVITLTRSWKGVVVSA